MKKKKLCFLLWNFFLLLFIFTEPASALSITVGDNIADNTFMAEGSSIDGIFDISSALLAYDQDNTPYDIIGGYYTFIFEDDDDYWNYGHTIKTTYRYLYKNSPHSISYRYNYFYDEFEQVGVNVEGQYSIDHTNWYSSITRDSRRGHGRYTSRPYFYTNYDISQGYGGMITVTQSLGPELLNSLATDGVINFSLSANYGDIKYLTGSLTANVDEKPFSVPEPATLFALGSGLVGLAFIRKRPGFSAPPKI